MKIAISLLFLLLFSFFGSAQYTEKELNNIINTSSESQLVHENTQLMLLKYYYQSVKIADKLLELQPENANYNYRKGYAMLYSQSDYMQSLPYLEKACKKVSKNYDASNDKEDAAPIDVYYHMGHCYHLAGQIAKAEASFNKYLEVAPNNNELIYYCQLALTQCAVAKNNLANPNSEYEIKNLGAIVNSKYPDYSPTISLDGTALYFTSRRPWGDTANANLRSPKNGQFFEDIYVAYTDFAGDWEDPLRLILCEENRMEATVSVSADERRIYLYQDNEKGNGDIYYSPFEVNRFDSILDYEVKGVNTPSWEPHLTVTPDGNNIYFVSNRPGGFGGRDIYRIVKLPNGKWSKPINLGETINTAYDEDAPFIAVDNKTMYFASNGEKSMGGFDIFLSIRDDNNKWSTPINLGSPLNSTGDDLFYTTTVDGLTGYLTSFRKGGLGEKDIYEIKNNYLGLKNIAVLKGQIFVEGDKPLPPNLTIKVHCLNCGETNTRTVFPRMRDGVYFSSLSPCRKYELIYQYGEDNKEFHREQIKTGCDLGYEEIYVPVTLNLEDMTIHPYSKYKLSGIIKDAKENLIENAVVQLIDKKNQTITLASDTEGFFKTDLLSGKEKGDTVKIPIQVAKDGFETIIDTINVTLAEDTNIIVHYTLLQPVTDLLLEVKPIYFDLNSSLIRDDARIELDKIVKIMNENPTLKIEFGSHTDCRASMRYNIWLSDRRAKNTAKYIKSRITNPDRIFGKGYGETQLTSDCPCEGEQKSTCSEEQHQLNRRSVFKIIK